MILLFLIHCPAFGYSVNIGSRLWVHPTLSGHFLELDSSFRKFLWQHLARKKHLWTYSSLSRCLIQWKIFSSCISCSIPDPNRCQPHQRSFSDPFQIPSRFFLRIMFESNNLLHLRYQNTTTFIIDMTLVSFQFTSCSSRSLRNNCTGLYSVYRIFTTC